LQLTHEQFREAFMVAFDGLIKGFGRDAVERGEIGIEYNPQPSHGKDHLA